MGFRYGKVKAKVIGFNEGSVQEIESMNEGFEIFCIFDHAVELIGEDGGIYPLGRMGIDPGG